MRVQLRLLGLVGLKAQLSNEENEEIICQQVLTKSSDFTILEQIREPIRDATNEEKD